MKAKRDPAAVEGDRVNIEYAAGGFDLPVVPLEVLLSEVAGC